jgi:hypothetical protein
MRFRAETGRFLRNLAPGNGVGPGEHRCREHAASRSSAARGFRAACSYALLSPYFCAIIGAAVSRSIDFPPGNLRHCVAEHRLSVRQSAPLCCGA